MPYQALDTAVWSLRQELTGVFTVVVDANQLRNRSAVFSQFAAAFQFPEYFGGTWNAFADCLGDLSWLAPKAFVLIVRDAPVLLIEGDPDEFSLFLKIVEEIGDSFAQNQVQHSSTPFHAVFHALPEAAAAFDLRLRAAGRVTPGLPVLSW